MRHNTSKQKTVKHVGQYEYLFKDNKYILKNIEKGKKHD